MPFLFVFFSEATDPGHVQIMSETKGEAGEEERREGPKKREAQQNRRKMQGDKELAG